MTFEEYIEKEILRLRIRIEMDEGDIWKLEGALVTYRQFTGEALPAPETRQEALPAPEDSKVADPPSEPPQDEPKMDRRTKKYWSPERKAEASRLATERWQRRRAKMGGTKNMKSEVERVPPAAAVSVSPEVFRVIPDAVKEALNITQSKPDIVQIDSCPLSIVGMVLLKNGKFAAHVDKAKKAILEDFIRNFGETVDRSVIKAIAPNADQAVLNLKPLIGHDLDIVATETGWKMVTLQKEVV